jgi:hypothetical protein
MVLEYEPLELEWRQAEWSGELEEAKVIGENTVEACVYERMLTPQFGGCIIITNRHKHEVRHWVYDDDLEACKRECERVSGLLLAALGLERPGEG